jgi:hypothetical protein
MPAPAELNDEDSCSLSFRPHLSLRPQLDGLII